ncbi:hypothetical protein O9G_006091 [Rozella allomycis CSF55]|uniref:Reverse transcriptase Ty1/copia-type domain-containing protein n=1 Tax=Rozella allomycis (strain CSF55) TaxID=988480 RepID=A0A075AV12_ROZAC|nr:hypothetical protein O9G_006091 [Rozella allomycis CSF55]|eukprot:EPZ34116.1 hypothetical protein O9G_006091 [Rozella allomycis CSF55]
MSALGECKYVSGLELFGNRENKTIILHQQSYVSNLLKRTNMGDCILAVTPFDPILKKMMVLQNPYVNHFEQSLDVFFSIAIKTRPDICFALNLLSRFQDSRRNIHWLCLKRELRYLKGTPDVGICLGGLAEL